MLGESAKEFSPIDLDVLWASVDKDGNDVLDKDEYD